MGDNGELKPGEIKEMSDKEMKAIPEVDPNKPKVVMRVVMHPNGEFEMTTSLIPPMVFWVMEQIKFNILQSNAEEKSKIVTPPKGGIMNFARRFK